MLKMWLSICMAPGGVKQSMEWTNVNVTIRLLWGTALMEKSEAGSNWQLSGRSSMRRWWATKW